MCEDQTPLCTKRKRVLVQYFCHDAKNLSLQTLNSVRRDKASGMTCLWSMCMAPDHPHTTTHNDATHKHQPTGMACLKLLNKRACYNKWARVPPHRLCHPTDVSTCWHEQLSHGRAGVCRACCGLFALAHTHTLRVIMCCLLESAYAIR